MKDSRSTLNFSIALPAAVFLATVSAAAPGDAPTLKRAYRHRFYVGAAINRTIATGKPAAVTERRIR